MSYALLLTVLGLIGAGIAATLLTFRPTAAPVPDVAPDVATIEVQSVTGLRFTGRLRDDPITSTLRPMLAVRAAFDQMLVDKGLLTGHQLDLLRHGTRSHGVVTGMRSTGETREDYREVELDVIVSKPGGGQFAVHETALIPASSMAKVAPGSVIDTYFRPGNETEIAVSVPPS